MGLDLRSSELEHCFIKERLSNVEKHFSHISLKLAAYNKAQASLRDNGDEMAKCILSYASKENLNVSLRTSLTQFADILFAIQAYRDAQIQRVDVKVVMEFSNYKPLCKKAKTDLKTSFDIRAKELTKKNQLEKTRAKNPTNLQKIAQAEKDLNQAKDEATHSSVELSKKLDDFEKRKIEDMKNAFLEFIKIEMIFHAKAIELYTTAYNVIKNVKVEEDLKEFRSHFRSYRSVLHPDLTMMSHRDPLPADATTAENDKVDLETKMAESGTSGSRLSLFKTPPNFLKKSHKTSTHNESSHSKIEQLESSFDSDACGDH